jgi:uncharacterized protein (DUF952 family)
MILHILKRGEWQEATRAGCYAPSSLENEGFIHCSTVAQAVAPANLFFSGEKDLVIICIDEARLASQLKFELPAAADDARPSACFPHIYGSLNLDAVIRVVDFPCNADGSFELPADL